MLYYKESLTALWQSGGTDFHVSCSVPIILSKYGKVVSSASTIAVWEGKGGKLPEKLERMSA